MDTKKSLALVLAAALVLLCAGGGAAAAHFAKDAKENKALFLNELRALETAAAAEPFADDIFTAALEKQTCTGDWAKVEKAAKACLRDVHSCFEEMQTVRVYYDFFWLITGDNIVEDGPDFEASLAQVDTAAARAGEVLARTETLLRPETVRSYLAGANVKKPCETLFEEAFAQPMDTKSREILSKMQAMYDSFMQQAEACRTILTYYRDHPDGWLIENGAVFVYEDAMAGFDTLAPYIQLIYDNPPAPRTADPRF